MKQLKTTSRKRLPIISKCFYGFFGISAILYFLFVWSPAFSEWFNQKVAGLIRRFLSALTSWMPFSFAELLLILLPLWIFLLIRVAIKKYTSSWHNTAVFLGILGSFVALVASLFVWTIAPGYYGEKLEAKLQLERIPCTEDELFQTACILAKEINAVEKNWAVNDSGSSKMPYSFAEMNQKLQLAYQKADEKYDFLKTFSSNSKQILLSKPMAYTHITGVYSFFTGEANVNVYFPDYTVPFTAAHEMAHQRGIAREEEANFVAFLVCMESNDDYIRYSAYLNVFEYVTNALYEENSALFEEAFLSLNDSARLEEYAFAEFFRPLQDNIAADVSGVVNDTYLKTQGNEAGTKSYDLVVDLAVAYYRPFFE